MSIILSVDTSTEACSVALYIDGEVVEDFAMLERRHAGLVLPMIDGLLKKTGMAFSRLDAVAFGRGPGSFTGLRIAAGVAQGIAFGTGVGVVPVSTLAALALQAHRLRGESQILSCIDARIGEVYWGYFQAGKDRITLCFGEGLCVPAELPPPPAAAHFGAGNGWQFRDSMSAGVTTAVQRFDASLLPRAGDIAVLAARIFREGGAIPPEDAVPVYLRDKVTHQR